MVVLGFCTDMCLADFSEIIGEEGSTFSHPISGATMIESMTRVLHCLVSLSVLLKHKLRLEIVSYSY